MRLFAAIPLPSPLDDAVQQLLRSLAVRGWPVRWVRDEGIHLTVKYFGETASTRTDTIGEMMAFATQGLPPIAMALAGGGAFPTNDHPRVLRVDIRAGQTLDLLQDRMERGGEQIGFPPEGRPFRPHVTLGRVREGHRLPPAAMDYLRAAIPTTPPVLADRVVLYESEPGPGGARYINRLELPLVGDGVGEDV